MAVPDESSNEFFGTLLLLAEGIDETFVNDSKLAHLLRFCRIILLVPADVSIRVFSVPAHAWAVFPE
jgi:hypothetical protein